MHPRHARAYNPITNLRSRGQSRRWQIQNRIPILNIDRHQFIKLSDGNKEYIYTLAEGAAPAGFEIALSAAFRHSLTRA